jgi:hypothetical protein
VSVKQGSTFLEIEDDYQHITTAVGYMIDYEFPVRREKPVVNLTIEPTLNYFNKKV